MKLFGGFVLLLCITQYAQCILFWKLISVYSDGDCNNRIGYQINYYNGDDCQPSTCGSAAGTQYYTTECSDGENDPDPIEDNVPPPGWLVLSLWANAENCTTTPPNYRYVGYPNACFFFSNGFNMKLDSNCGSSDPVTLNYYMGACTSGNLFETRAVAQPEVCIAATGATGTMGIGYCMPGTLEVPVSPVAPVAGPVMMAPVANPTSAPMTVSPVAAPSAPMAQTAPVATPTKKMSTAASLGSVSSLLLATVIVIVM